MLIDVGFGSSTLKAPEFNSVQIPTLYFHWKVLSAAAFLSGAHQVRVALHRSRRTPETQVAKPSCVQYDCDTLVALPPIEIGAKYASFVRTP